MFKILLLNDFFFSKHLNFSEIAISCHCHFCFRAWHNNRLLCESGKGKVNIKLNVYRLNVFRLKLNV